MKIPPLSEILDAAHSTLSACAGLHSDVLGEACEQSAREIDAYLKQSLKMVGGPAPALPIKACVAVLEAAGSLGCATMMFSRTAADGGVIQTIIVIANNADKATKLHAFARTQLEVGR